MKVVVLCEYSGTVRDAFTAKGHDATSCDYLDTESPGKHYKGDARDLLDKDWDLIIAHPTYTYMANSGVSWLYKDKDRWDKLEQSTTFFLEIWNAPCRRIAIENPIMHKHAKQQIGIRQTQVIQPWMFGHAESKATCLWLKGLPPLVETNNVKALMQELPKNKQQRLHYLPPGPDRWKFRSRTFQGVADAMAEQWG